MAGELHSRVGVGCRRGVPVEMFVNGAFEIQGQRVYLSGSDMELLVRRRK